jgi:hypothetical protein
MPTPFISVLIDTFNQERFIKQALDSVLAQDYPADRREILVVDDGSADNTPAILAKYGSQIRILRKDNGGQASAFNFAIPQCTGEIVAFLDGDDWWSPNKLSLLAQAFECHPTVGLVGNSITEVLADGSQRSELVRDAPQFRLDSLTGARKFRLRKSFLGTSRMAYRVELLRRIGTVPDSLIFEADEFLFTLGSLFSEVLVLREPLTFYRLHGQNLFQVHLGANSGMRRKHDVLLALHSSLQQRFAQERVPADISRAVLESVQTEADLIALSLDGGSSLHAVRVELRSYRIMNEGAPPLRKFLKYASLFPALFLSPRRYAALRQKLAASPLYRKLRSRFLPALGPNHVDRTGHWSAP